VRFAIQGTWEGEYSYNPTPGLVASPVPTRFTLAARSGWFGALTGVMRDDPVGGPPEAATVSGRVVGQLVTFTKRYPTLYVRYADRTVTIREYLEATEGLHLDAHVPGAPILYEGTFDAAGECATGTWRLTPLRVRFRSDGKLREFRVTGTSGRWVMRRAGTEVSA
jgi:hypothetical protein